jgi:hypothetical protein
VVLAFGRVVPFLPYFPRIFAGPGENPWEIKEVKYLAAAGKSGVVGATA